MPTPPHVQLIVRLPFNRPDPASQPSPDPPRIVWNAEKEAVLWELIARSRMSENSSTDWQGLSMHLDVPLPYLLYRAQTRYEQDLKGLQHVGGAFNAIPPKISPEGPRSPLLAKISTGSPRMATNNLLSRQGSRTSPTLLKHSGASSSMSTVRQRISTAGLTTLPQSAEASVSDGESDDSEEEKAEEEERRRDEQENVAKKLKDLEKLMSSDVLGFARLQRKRVSEPEQRVDLGSRRADNASGSTSSSVRGSIPSIPSPPSGSQSSSRIHTPSSAKSKLEHSSPSRNSRAVPTRYAALERAMISQKSSNQGSSSSSFSDVEIMSDASVSASALEDAIMSNIRGGGSRLSMFTRSHFAGRGPHA